MITPGFLAGAGTVNAENALHSLIPSGSTVSQVLVYFSALFLVALGVFAWAVFRTRSPAGGIRIIIIRSRRQNTSGNTSIVRAIRHWRKPVACRRFAPKNSLHPRPDWERIINGRQPVKEGSRCRR